MVAAKQMGEKSKDKPLKNKQTNKKQTHKQKQTNRQTNKNPLGISH